MMFFKFYQPLTYNVLMFPVVSAPRDLRVTGVTPSTVVLQWSIVNFTQPCLDIRGYEILYRRTYPRPEKMGKIIAVDSNKKEIEYPIKNLWQKTNFSIQVRPFSPKNSSLIIVVFIKPFILYVYVVVITI